MGQTLAPYGLYPRRVQGSQRNTAGCTQFDVTVETAAPLWYGAPVALVAGSVKAVTASPTTTGSANSPCGVLQGAYWEDKYGPHFSAFLPAGIIAAGGKKITVLINDDPQLIFMAQASAVLGPDAVGKNAALLNPGAGNAAFGRSTCAVDAASVATTATLAVKIVRVLDLGNPFPDLLVQWNANVHQYVNGFSS